jgi:hypothetical protein
MDTNIGMLADERQLFPQVEAILQIGNTRLSLTNDRERRGRLQPGREALLSHPGPDGAQQLEEAPPAKQIQVSGIDMVGIIEPRTLLPGTAPLILDTAQSPPIKVRCPARAQVRPPRPLMSEDQHGECSNAQQQPAGGEEVPEEREPAGNQDHTRQSKPRYAEVVEYLA